MKEAELIKNADAILVSASNGLSIAEGVHIFADNEPFHIYFDKYVRKYGITSLIQGVFTPMSREDHEGYMRQVHKYLIDDYHGSEVYRNLRKILSGKDYFIVTSNGDTHFQINGFDPAKIFEAEGNFDGLEEGSEPWQKQQENFSLFVNKHKNSHVLQMELGIGAGNQLIKAPLMQLTAACVNWQYMTFNLPEEINILPALKGRSTAVQGDIDRSLQEIAADF